MFQKRSVLLILLILSASSFSSAQYKASRELVNFWRYQITGSYLQKQANPGRIYERTVLAKAAPDESFNGVGSPYMSNPFSPGGVPKVNQAYVWGLARAGEDLWFGTIANTLCLVVGALMIASGEEEPYPIGGDHWICEFGESDFTKDYLFGLLPPYAGDYRPPEIWVYDTNSGLLQEKTVLVTDEFNLNTTAGFRSAGAHNNVVFLGGPNFSEGITLFAFNTVTGQYIGSKTFSQYSNIRQWIVVNNVLYTGVANSDGSGSILRWKGNSSNPFQFDVVGNLDGDAAYLAEHEGRLFATTWPSVLSQMSREEIDYDNITMAGLYMSPLVPPGGLQVNHASQWVKVWQVDDYEPDRVTAVSYGGGALASFDGDLYFGTMNVPLASTVAHLVYYASVDSVALYFGTFRPISILRGSNFSAAGGDFELLYGMEEMPVYTPGDSLNPALGGSWSIEPNNMGQAPLYGPGGFGNAFNNYTWSMAVFEGDLFVGTMDWSMLYEVFLDFYGDSATTALHDSAFGAAAGREGGDLWRFVDGDSPAVLESGNGLDNFGNYGFRTVISADRFYLGMANPMNIMTDPNDGLPEGGWELLELIPCDCDVEDVTTQPASFLLHQNYPNPFNPSTSIGFEVREKRHVNLKVFDTSGREVATIVDEVKPAGKYRVRFDAAGLPAGVYMAQIKMGAYRAVKKMVLVK